MNLDTHIRGHFEESIELKRRIAQTLAPQISRAGEALAAALRNDRKVLACGNGGSAADSQHFAAEMVGRFRIDRQPLPAIALTTDTSVITSIANDFAYDRVFVRQVEAFGRPGDVALGITTSGRSPSVLEALAQARRQELTTVALVGSHSAGVDALADITIPVPAENTARIQEAHRTTLHIICELIEERLESRGGRR